MPPAPDDERRARKPAGKPSSGGTGRSTGKPSAARGGRKPAGAGGADSNRARRGSGQSEGYRSSSTVRRVSGYSGAAAKPPAAARRAARQADFRPDGETRSWTDRPRPEGSGRQRPQGQGDRTRSSRDGSEARARPPYRDGAPVRRSGASSTGGPRVDRAPGSSRAGGNPHRREEAIPEGAPGAIRARAGRAPVAIRQVVDLSVPTGPVGTRRHEVAMPVAAPAAIRARMRRVRAAIRRAVAQSGPTGTAAIRLGRARGNTTRAGGTVVGPSPTGFRSSDQSPRPVDRTPRPG